MFFTVGLEGRDDSVVAVALAGILAAEVATEELEFATRDVHADSLAHAFEVLDEGGSVLAGGKSEPGVACDLLGEGAGVAVTSEVWGVFVADVGLPRVTVGGLFTDLKGAIGRRRGGGESDGRKPGRGCRCCNPSPC